MDSTYASQGQSAASIDATYASQGRADVGCGNGVNGPSSTSAAFGGTAYVQLDPQLLQHRTSGDLLFPFRASLTIHGSGKAW